MKHSNTLSRMLMIGLLLSLGAKANLCAQELKAPPQTAVDQAWLTSKLKGQKSIVPTKIIQQKDVDLFETLLAATLSGIRRPKEEMVIENLRNRWASQDWQLLKSPSGKFFVVREHPDHQRGRGVYAFQTKSQSSIVLQAPHRFNDLMTGSITIKLFCEQAVAAVAINTIHRSAIDLSHTPLHFINAFTSVVIKARPDVTILQIHGFTNKGKTGAAKLAKLIVSDSTKFPGRLARQSAIELKTTFGAEPTRLFPIDIHQLGGTTNRQAEVAHGLGCPNFLHLELNREFRGELDADASVRETFFASLLRGSKN